MLAALVPLLAARFKRFHIPVVIGEILAGTLIGKSGFDIVESSQVLDFLSEFGFVILMFISGLELDVKSFSFSSLKQAGKSFRHTPLWLAFLGFLLTLGLAFSAAFLFQQWGFIQEPLVIGLILSATSMGVVVPILKERNLTTTSYGQLIVQAALLADFITLMLLSLTLGMMMHGIVLRFMIFMVLLAIFALTLKMGFRFRRIPGLRTLLEGLTTATVQIRTRISIALMVAWVALAQALGTEVILGAFLAGVIMSIMADSDKSALQEKLDTIGFGFFIPMFFISVGSEFDIRSFLGSFDALLLLPLLVGAAYLVKVLPSLVYLLSFSLRESAAAGFLLSSHLSLTIAASALAFKSGMITETVNADILVLAMITCMLSPILFNRIMPAAAQTQRQGYIVIGLNEHTALLIERLIQEGEKVSVLQSLREPCREPFCRGARIKAGDPEDEEILQELGAETAAGLVVVLNDPEVDLAVCQMATERFRIPIVVSYTDDHGLMQKMKALGARVVQPALATAIALESALRYHAVFDMIANQSDGVELGEARVTNRSLQGMEVGDIRLPGNALIMGIRRNGEVIVPHGNTPLALNDVVMLVGNPEFIADSIQLLEME